MMPSFTQKGRLSRFAGKHMCRRYPGGGREQPAERRPVGQLRGRLHVVAPY
jgi:hypothetical protein